MENRVTVLLIEDDPDYTMLMNTYVDEACGDSVRYALETVDSLQGGLDRLAREEFDVVLLDLMLPDSQGLETLDRVRARAPGVPVVVLTNLDHEDMSLAAIARGAQDFLSKDKIDARRLGHAVGFALARHRLFRQMEILVDGSPDGVVIVDRERMVRYANEAALTLFGRRKDQLVGRLFDYPTAPGKAVELKLAGGAGPIAAEMRVAEIEWKGYPAWLASIRDVTQLKKLEEARVEVRERTRMDQMKDQLLSTVAHELRTPLNSLLLLARQLADNLEKNLSNKQIEYAQTICSAGNDLLALINDILDLSKIEAGAMTIEIQPMTLSSLKDYLVRNFDQLAHSKKLRFDIELAEDLPQSVRTDPKRLQQVLRNLLSNAFKFTEKGSVTVRVEPAEPSAAPESIRGSGPLVAYSVVDTGIGIHDEKQAIIFEAFQQVDGGIDRKYGGTGLGLTISREIARLLGGEIRVHSSPGVGSTFTLYLPLTGATPKSAPRRRIPDSAEAVAEAPSPERPTAEAASANARPAEIVDDRNAILPGDMVLLIVEDDATFAKLLLDIAREHGFKGVVALQGDAGLATARLTNPQAAVVDLRLPDMTGWMVLDGLKHDPALRHIPVLIMSGAPDEERRALKMGAIGYLEKPATRETLSASLTKLVAFIRNPSRRVLLVENDADRRQAIIDLVGGDGVSADAVGDGVQALARLKAEDFQCAIIDTAVPDVADFMNRLAREPQLNHLPLLIYAGRKLKPGEEHRLRKAARLSVAKLVQSPEHLRDESGLFLHRNEAARAAAEPERKPSDSVLAGRRILVVDDDVRNLFSITSVLERYAMRVLSADNGRKGIETLERTPDVDIVLMDVMMPEMNGYEAMAAIRRNSRFRSLPIVAVTAKAMKGDREKCIQAGASDYIPKPVDVEQLLAVLRVWLS